LYEEGIKLFPMAKIGNNELQPTLPDLSDVFWGPQKLGKTKTNYQANNKQDVNKTQQLTVHKLSLNGSTGVLYIVRTTTKQI
jgi:hypothetical protein